MINLSNLLNLVKYPSLTEKSINLYGNSQYTFIVDRSLTKIEIKFILENIFNVKIIQINTAILPVKKKKSWKIYRKSIYIQKSFC